MRPREASEISSRRTSVRDGPVPYGYEKSNERQDNAFDVGLTF